MMRRRRIITTAALLLCAALFLSLPGGVLAANDVIFTSVDNTLLDLNDETMPVSISGNMYVPYTVFTSTGLQIYYAYNRSEQTFTLYRDTTLLIFDLASSTSTDTSGTLYYNYATLRNNIVYLPVRFVCGFFDLEYSYVTSSYLGDIVRVKSSGKMLDDDTFAQAAVYQLRSKLSEYQGNKAGASSSASTPPPPSDTPSSTPSETPSPSQSPGEPEDVPQTYEDTTVYLRFDGIDAETTPAVLALLSEYGCKAAFFVSAREVRDHTELIRRIAGEGHTIGIYCVESSDELKETSGLLTGAARYRTLICSGSDPALARECLDLGYIWWDYSFDRAGTLLSRELDTSGQAICIRYECGEDAAAQLDADLKYLRSLLCDLRPLRETTAPITDLQTGSE